MNCPVCNGDMWDNRSKKKNPKAPDYRCKDENCKFALNPDTGEYEESTFTTGVWLPKETSKPPKSKEKDNDPALQGKKDNNRLICRTDLMVGLVRAYGVGTSTEEIKNMFNDLWQEIEK